METPRATRAHPPDFSASHCYGTPCAEQSRVSRCLHHKQGVGNSGKGPSEPSRGLAAIFALWMFLWTSGELWLDVSVAEASAGSSVAVLVCGFTLGVCVCVQSWCESWCESQC